MAKKQKRRSISLKPETYVRLRIAAADAGMSLTSWAEETLTIAMNARGTRDVTREEALRTIPDAKTVESTGASGVWTF